MAKSKRSKPTHNSQLSEKQLRELLAGLRVRTEDIPQNNTPALQTLLKRSLDKVQHLSESIKSKGGFDPSSLPKGKADIDFVAAFCHNRSMEEIHRVISGLAEKDIYLQYRETLALIAKFHQELGCCNAILQDKTETTGLALQICGLRQADFDEGTPIIEVQYMYNTRSNFSVQSQTALSKTFFHSGGSTNVQTVKATIAEILLFKQVLDLNADKLAPAYRQDSRRAWGVVEPFAVSFLVPAGHLTVSETASVQTQCANAGCGQPGTLRCGKCKEVSFCSKECQLANWPRHKQQCGKPAGSAEGLEEPAGAPGNHSDDAGKRSVEVSLVDGSGMFEFAIPFNQTVKENVRRSKGLDDGIRDSTKAPPDIHGDKRFLVKVQVALCGGPHMMYDERRSFTVTIAERQAAFQPLNAIIRTSGYQGAKAYFWARRLSATTLKIFIDDRPSSKPFW